MKKTIGVLLLILVSVAMHSQTTVALWENDIPDAINNSNYQEKPVLDNGVLVKIQKVVKPTLTIYKPKKPNGTAIVICPGGGYRHLSMDKEGFKVAEWLNTLGVTAIVLKYRLPSDSIMKNKSVGPLQDAQEAMRYVRRHAAALNIDPSKVGVLGFSAGGHLAATLSTQYDLGVYKHDNTSAKPDFSILIYPVISMDDSVTHQGSKTNLLGESPSFERMQQFSNELQVDEHTPMTFIVHATDDKSVPVENSLRYYMALKKHQVPAELHIYEKGGHGFGLGRKYTSQFWTFTCEKWLLSHTFTTSKHN
ncbi:alpha/beta hydrolase [Meridianimaribacter sp. CL38]|uniref:alpha/beta hydrolase n=1 Tax=Meridianimaribacter sp. CL38 TaxID=2213021 RepID=UPI00103DEBEC|nr:alpha/beta hydrolase [Meridianimaribacter sp. CL38]TBV27634.1 alpha/beta hydrolase [Meridianimaribacter sp. CL38]